MKKEIVFPCCSQYDTGYECLHEESWVIDSDTGIVYQGKIAEGSWSMAADIETALGE